MLKFLISAIGITSPVFLMTIESSRYSVIPPNLIASNADIAILLMCLENFFVFVFLSYLSKKDISFFSEDLQNKPHYDRPSFKLFIGITALVVLLVHYQGCFFKHFGY